jgi:putative ribosome biogenesis GTPase RsgA
MHEPHCAIKEAVEQNIIADWRYNDYCNMMEDSL